MRYVTLDFADDKGEDELARGLDRARQGARDGGNRVYYFAVPPSAIGTLVEEIGERRAAEGWMRLMIEKPFGHDLAVGARAERAAPAALRGERDLPDRPLPRQGDGAEHAGAAVRAKPGHRCRSRSAAPRVCTVSWPWSIRKTRLLERFWSGELSSRAECRSCPNGFSITRRPRPPRYSARRSMDHVRDRARQDAESTRFRSCHVPGRAGQRLREVVLALSSGEDVT